MRRTRMTLALVLALGCAPLSAEQPADAVQAQPADPLAAFTWMDGQWRGKARILTAKGPAELVQTERSGTMLGGKVRLVEGRGYAPDGKLAFNAFGTIAAKPGGGLELRSWTLEQSGSFTIEPTPSGFTWSIPAGPATIRYEARFENGIWTEIGTRIVPGREPLEFYRMELTRIGAGNWPAAGEVGPG